MENSTKWYVYHRNLFLVGYLQLTQKMQKRLNLFGGERVNVELLPTLQEYIKQAESGNPEWITQLCKYYGLIAGMSKI